MNCFITYDYELCLGAETGTPEGCLIRPMDALCEMFEKYGVKVNVFVDAAYLLRLHELKDQYAQLQEDYNKVSENVRYLSKKGHSIQLHFHPQWINAQFINAKWELDNEHYKLSDFPIDVQINKLSKAIELLQTLSDNTIVAFRAGGFSIENFKELAPLLYNKGIFIDTSVLRGGFINSRFQTYDYRNIPSSSSYHFRDSNKIDDNDGCFIEYPISVMEVSSLLYVYLKNFKRNKLEKQYKSYSNQRWNDGLGIGESLDKKTRIINILKRLFLKSPLYASADGSLVFFLKDVLLYSSKKYRGDDFVIIGHPKIATPRTVAALEQFIHDNRGILTFKTFS